MASRSLRSMRPTRSEWSTCAAATPCHSGRASMRGFCEPPRRRAECPVSRRSRQARAVVHLSVLLRGRSRGVGVLEALALKVQVPKALLAKSLRSQSCRTSAAAAQVRAAVAAEARFLKVGKVARAGKVVKVVKVAKVVKAANLRVASTRTETPSQSQRSPLATSPRPRWRRSGCRDPVPALRRRRPSRRRPRLLVRTSSIVRCFRRGSRMRRSRP